MKKAKVKIMMNVFWPGESGWSVSVSAAITADSRATGQQASLSPPSSAADSLTTDHSCPHHTLTAQKHPHNPAHWGEGGGGALFPFRNA